LVRQADLPASELAEVEASIAAAREDAARAQEESTRLDEEYGGK
jgi:outer membrane murein-binding lipoprotein Lpp